MQYFSLLFSVIIPQSISDPKLLIPIIILAIAIFAPFLLWFLRNFFRIFLKKQWEWFNRALKWFFLSGLILFILSLILLILPIVGVY